MMNFRNISLRYKIAAGIAIFVVLAVVIIVPIVVTVNKDSNKPDGQVGETSPITSSTTLETATTSSSTTGTTPGSTTTKKPFDPNDLKGDEATRINCYLEAQSRFENLTKYACEKRNCIYNTAVSHELVPICYFDRENLGYKFSKKNNDYEYVLKQSGKAPFPGEIDEIQLNVEYYGNNIIRVKIFDPKNARYEVPLPLNKPAATTNMQNVKGEFVVDPASLNSNNLFNFKIMRRENNKVIFDTSVGGFVFSEQFLQIGTKLTTTNIYGFGENNHESFKHNLNFMSWGMFTRDNAPGWGDNKNLYGHQPYYMGVEEGGKAHGVLFLNSNAQEYLFTPSPSLILRSIGGIFDFYFIIDEDPMTVSQSYHSLIGLPVFPPYWSFGFHLSRWGYEDLQEMKDVIKRTKDAKIPQDVQHADIDYMIGFRDFTVDPENFNGLYDYFEGLQKEGMKLVLILDPGLVVERNYTPFTTGLENDVFIRWPENIAPVDYDLYSNYVISWCWPNQKIVYPDFFRKGTYDWWQQTIDAFRKNRTHGAPIDGIWIDMNEPSSFETNEEKPWNWLWPDGDERYPYFTLKCPPNRLDDPPYRTKNMFMFDDDGLILKKARLSQKTICMISKQGDESNSYYHYDVHSLYGYTQAKATDQALRNLDQGKRPFVLTRSTYVGSGHHAIHWTGDVDSIWKHLKMSLIGIFEFGMFGMPMVGTDICGFFQHTNLQLCQRWHQFGAFYPFARNHNSKGAISQDPAVFGDESMINSTRETLNIRYNILPYMYTLFYHAHLKGGLVARPLLFEFPTDSNTYNIDEQLLLGPAFLVTPVLYENHVNVTGYFPDARWFDYRTGNELSARKKTITLDAPKDYINLHVRGGYILPTQDLKGALNTRDGRKNPFGLLVTLDDDSKAFGDLFWDDGEALVESNKFFYANFTFEEHTLRMEIRDNNYPDIINNHFDEIVIYGVNEKYDEVLLNGDVLTQKPTYNEQTKVLGLKNLNIKLNANFALQFKKSAQSQSMHILRGD